MTAVLATAAAGPWLLGERLGGGGQATVHRARHATLGRVAAVKIIHPSAWADPAFRARFRRECRALAALRHPNVVPVIDAGESGEGGYLAMPLARGGSLAERLRAGAPPVDEAVALLSALAAALDAVHAAGHLHRDVTPANVLLDPAGPWLADFGLARPLEATAVTAEGLLVGTAGFMAPEVIAGGRAGPAADRYALAALAFEALTGRPPFTGEGAGALLYAHARQAPPRASALRSGLPRALDRALARGLAKRPAERHPSAAALAEEIAAALDGGATRVLVRAPRRRGGRARPLRGAAAALAAAALAAGAVAVVPGGADRASEAPAPAPAPAPTVPGPGGRAIPAGPAGPADLAGAPVPEAAAAATVGGLRVTAAPASPALLAGVRGALEAAGYAVTPLEGEPGGAPWLLARRATFDDVLGRSDRWALAVTGAPGARRLVAVRGRGDGPARYVAALGVA